MGNGNKKNVKLPPLHAHALQCYSSILVGVDPLAISDILCMYKTTCVCMVVPNVSNVTHAQTMGSLTGVVAYESHTVP